MRLTALVGALALVGCASTSPPLADVVRAHEAVQVAEDAAAATSPLAAQYLMLAKDELARAEQLAERDQTPDAQRWARRAHADADLAILAAREADVRAELERTQREIQRLELRLGASSASTSGTERVAR
jgi:hypothetical protein